MSTPYYLGLDIGTDSVGYAVTDEYYQLQKRRGEPVWGVTTFEAANLAQERRAFRTARRRIDRRQQRVSLVNEIFAADIGKLDPRFFIRRAESRLYRDEAGDDYALFNDRDFTDKEYYAKYPTIHHLILDLMQSEEAHDLRLVYLACTWLVAHRGHFLFDVPADKIERLLDFGLVYDEFCTYLMDNGCGMPWSDSINPDQILSILKMSAGVKRKQDEFKAKIYSGSKPAKEPDTNEGGFPYSRDAVVTLLCGGKVKPEDVFKAGLYEDVESVSLSMGDEDFVRIIAELGDDGELLLKLRALKDCAMLITAQNGKLAVSEAKVAVYEQHRQDLANLKAFVRKYIPKEYNAIFRDAGADNYVAYSYNVKSCKKPGEVKSKASSEKFCKFLLGKVKNLKPGVEDEAFYSDMLARLEINSFLPKQKTTDNRIIPQQLFRYELNMLLDKAERYTPLLRRRDDSGLTNKEKILSIFDFRIPYFVGPLNGKSKNAWIERKGEGKLYPWNFKSLVDYDASEQSFIARMTNYCTYIPGEDTLPQKSLVYCKYTVLNEINNLKINGSPIPVDVKQRIYTDIFMNRPRVTLKNITAYLKSQGLMFEGAELTGVDDKLTSSLSSYHQFKRLLTSGVLAETDVENIISRAAYSEDKNRLSQWIKNEYPQISEADRKYIVRLDLKGFGRLSASFLNGITGSDKTTGEAFTIIEALWSTNNNLMQLLSDRFSFRSEIEEYTREYYADNPRSLTARLNEMYISNAVKRPIIRTLDICTDVVKAMGHSPEKIFIEMARGASPDQAGKRTKTRKQQLLDLYKQIKTDDARALEKELNDMGQMADNRLQSDRLFLYYLQMGKCAYTGQPIDLSRLSDGTYNIDHIYPQAFVKDDSILNNEVLVLSSVNGEKTNVYPLGSEIQKRMTFVWAIWRDSGLMTKEKYYRLTRTTPFTDDERWSFINRQLTETRQSTKAVAGILKERYPDSEIVYVKAGLVSEFRQEFDMLKCRSVNNLHHAKDAYLNIVVGNVYHERFTKNFYLTQNYSVKVKAIFTKPVKCGRDTVWQGETDLAKVRGTMRRNSAHLTRYAFCRKGGLFDQQPVKAAPGLVPLKANLPSEKYGGYNKPTASFFSLVQYSSEKRSDIVIMPVELLIANKFISDERFAEAYAFKTIGEITGKVVTSVNFILGTRILKINTMIQADGLRFFITGKSSGGRQLGILLCSPLIMSYEQEKYIKALESFKNKCAVNPQIQPNYIHDHISAEMNISLYDALTEKMSNTVFKSCPGNQQRTLKDGRDKFISNSITEQISLLLNVVSLMNPIAGTTDLSSIGGSKNAGSKLLSSSLSNWKKLFSSVKIVDASSSGLFESSTINLLDLL